MRIMTLTVIISLLFITSSLAFSVSMDRKHVFPGETFYLNFTELGPASHKVVVSLGNQEKKLYVHLGPDELFQKLIALNAPDKPGDYVVFVGDEQFKLTVEEPVVVFDKAYLNPDTANPDSYITLHYEISNPGNFSAENVTMRLNITDGAYTYEKNKTLSQVMMPGNSLEDEEVIKVGKSPKEANVYLIISYVFDGESHEITRELVIHTPSFPWIPVTVILVIIGVTAYYLKKRFYPKAKGSPGAPGTGPANENLGKSAHSKEPLSPHVGEGKPIQRPKEEEFEFAPSKSLSKKFSNKEKQNKSDDIDFKFD